MVLNLVVWLSSQAGEASRALQALREHSEPAARNAAVLIRDQNGQVFVFETGDVDRRHGTLLGAVVGLLMGLSGGPGPERVGVHAASLSFPEDYLTALQAEFEPGGSALVGLLEPKRTEGALDLLARFQGRVWRQKLADDLLAQLAIERTPEGR
jgi:uncharacterized membrane protein